MVKNAQVVVQGLLHRRFVEIHVINNRTGRLGEVHLIPRIHFIFTPPYSSWTVDSLQFPLCLAYATTFNSSQVSRSIDPCLTCVHLCSRMDSYIPLSAESDVAATPEFYFQNHRITARFCHSECSIQRSSTMISFLSYWQCSYQTRSQRQLARAAAQPFNACKLIK